MVIQRSALISGIVSFSLVGAPFVVSPLSHAADLQTIQQRGRLIVAVKENTRPLGFRGTDGQLQGLEIDIARRLAQELLGRPEALELKPVKNVDRLAAVLDGSVDLTIARVTGTAVRSRVVSFSVPYYMDGTAIVTRSPALQRIADIGNQTIAVLSGSSTIDTLRYRLPAAHITSVDSYDAARTMLETGAAIAFAADASVLAGWVQELPQYHLVTPPLSVEPLCIVMPKGLQYDDLRLRINAIVTRWLADGWLQERATYWGLP